MDFKIQTFLTELALIKDHDIRAFTELLIKSLHDRFFIEGASSTSKYHPDISNGEGGLVRHTKFAIQIAKSIIDTNMFGVVNESIVYSALILHDGWKYSDNLDNKYTVKDHAVLSVGYIKDIIKKSNFFDIYRNIPAWYGEILNCIQGHNGFFMSDKSKNEFEYNGVWSVEQKIVHIADYISSRRYMVAETKELTAVELKKILSKTVFTNQDITQMELDI